jgi:hypothetical protein
MLDNERVKGVCAKMAKAAGAVYTGLMYAVWILDFVFVLVVAGITAVMLSLILCTGCLSPREVWNVTWAIKRGET